jgi:hypothetical protein
MFRAGWLDTVVSSPNYLGRLALLQYREAILHTSSCLATDDGNDLQRSAGRQNWLGQEMARQGWPPTSVITYNQLNQIIGMFGEGEKWWS